MAKGQNASKTVVLNNNKSTTAAKTLELVVVNGALVHDTKDLEPGVDSRFLKN